MRKPHSGSICCMVLYSLLYHITLLKLVSNMYMMCVYCYVDQDDHSGTFWINMVDGSMDIWYWSGAVCSQMEEAGPWCTAMDSLYLIPSPVVQCCETFSGLDGVLFHAR